jgi:hypothetical protein
MATQVKFHGAPEDVPAAFGEARPATVAEATLRRAQIVAQRGELDQRLNPLIDKLQAGTATAEETASIAELGEDARILANRLRFIEIELRVAEDKQAQEEAATKRDRLDDLLIVARRKRSEFARLYRDACIVLGDLCASVDEASQIVNSFAAGSVAGMLPTDRNAVAEMSEDPNPLPALLDAGFSPTVNFGWNFSISVIPLKKKG